MKRFLFSALFLSLMVVGAQAQSTSCSKKCTAKEAASCTDKGAAATSMASVDEAAAKLASMDASIESKTCPVSGKVSYTKKETTANGEVSYVDVKYDAETNTFVNASAMKMEESKACSGQKAAGCCSGKSTASKSSGCCSGKATGASTSVSGGKTSESVKPVKG